MKDNSIPVILLGISVILLGINVVILVSRFEDLESLIKELHP